MMVFALDKGFPKYELKKVIKENKYVDDHGAHDRNFLVPFNNECFFKRR